MNRFTLSGRSLAAALLAVMTGAGVARAQTPTLGEVAKKEAERRKAQPNAGKVYTNKDLPGSAQKPAAAPSAPAASTETAPVDPVAAATSQKPADEKPEAEKTEGWWKQRMTTAREELRRNEMFADALQTRINSLNKDFSGRDNPAQRSRIAEDRTEALNELNRVKQAVERGKKQIQDIEEEARKAGVPPGWIR